MYERLSEMLCYWGGIMYDIKYESINSPHALLAHLLRSYIYGSLARALVSFTRYLAEKTRNQTATATKMIRSIRLFLPGRSSSRRWIQIADQTVALRLISGIMPWKFNDDESALDTNEREIEISEFKNQLL